MFGSLTDALEVGLDLALELEANTSRAAIEGFLYNIAAQLFGEIWQSVTVEHFWNLRDRTNWFNRGEGHLKSQATNCRDSTAVT